MSEFKTADEKEPEIVEKGDLDDAEDGDNEPAPEEESTATFTPVVNLEAIEVKTFEEDEEVVYKQKAKLFLYGESMLDKGTGNKQWKTRGDGDVKILKHKETGRLRVLMRQDKTMKIIINHFLDPRISAPVPHAGSDKAWVWIAFDFAECELLETTFAIKFPTPEIAVTFKEAFTQGQLDNDKLLKGEDAKVGGAEADAAADAIASLSVKSEETPTEGA